MLHFVYDTFIRLPFSGSFNGKTGSSSASRRVIIFTTDAFQNTTNQQVLNSIYGIDLNAFHELEKQGTNERQNIALINLKWVDKRKIIADIKELAVSLNDNIHSKYIV
jgi:hypothetical protein